METVIRVTVFYLVILVGLRLLGKREFSQMSPMELISLMLIPEIVSQALQREDYSVTNGIIGITTLFCLVFFNSVVSQLSPAAQDAVEGQPAVLAAHGRLLVDNMNRERVSPDDLMAEVRRSGLERLEQVRWALLESDGQISVVPEDDGDRAKRGGDRPNAEVG